MKNGCPKCEKLPDGKMCDMCELYSLQRTMEMAQEDYIDKVHKIQEEIEKRLGQ